MARDGCEAAAVLPPDELFLIDRSIHHEGLETMRIFFYKKFTNTPDIFIIIFLLVLTLSVRFPYWFPVVLDWDESTFILMGQSLLDGKLLYRDLWDDKPPLAFVSYALSIKLFGKSIIAVRLAGALCVLLSAVLTYYIGRKLFNKVSATLAAAIFILAASLLHSGQTTLTEHIALVPLLGSIFILLRRSLSPRLMLALGVLVSAAALVRLNLAFLAVVIGAIVVFHPNHKTVIARIKATAAYAAGGLGVVVLTAIPYLMAGEGDLWWTSLFVAPLAYADVMSPIGSFTRLTGGYIKPGKPTFLFSSLLLALSLGSMVWAVYRMATKGSDHRQQTAIVIIVTIGIAISLLKGGAQSHYLLQLAPFLSLFAAVAVEKSLCSRFFVPAALVLLAVVALALRPAYRHYQVLATRAAAGEAFSYGSAYQVADYVESLRLSNYTIFLMSDHIVYWLLDKQPPTRIAHPSVLFKPNVLRVVIGPEATPKTEIAAIFDQAPTIVVKMENPGYMRNFPDERQYIEQRLENYDLVQVIKNLRIYLIRDTPPDGSD